MISERAEQLDWAGFRSWFARHSGIDLSAYKETQMRRRIGQWVERHGCAGYADLARRVKQDASFDRAFRGYLTINTTQFYRDGPVFDTLRDDVLPRLLREGRPLRIWSAACSIGAEPYTVAMLLDALAGQFGGVRPDRHEIVATDIDDGALATAERGIYQADYFRELPSELRDAYCEKLGDKYEVSEHIRERVRFLHHNLLAEPPVGYGFDVVLCRNVLIYFVADVQDRLVEGLSNALREGGTLVVGSTEHVREPNRFALSRQSYCFYRKSELS